jgi:hypothetical protein
MDGNYLYPFEIPPPVPIGDGPVECRLFDFVKVGIMIDGLIAQCLPHEVAFPEFQLRFE